jgi:hypothetical protein
MAISSEDEKFKELVKAALIDVLEERRDLVKDILVEAIEDMALGKAINQGLSSDPISRDQISSFWKKHRECLIPKQLCEGLRPHLGQEFIETS